MIGDMTMPLACALQRPKRLKSFSALTLYGGSVFLFCCELAFAQQTNDTRWPDYVRKDISFKAYDEVAMFGRLVLPGSNAPRAIVIYVQTAEGATVDQKRPLGNGKTFNYFDVYREKLTAMGIGFFSYEGRGIRMGDDPPRYETVDWEVYNTSTLENKVRDVLSAIEAVRQQERLQRTPILLMGASEGTLLAAEAAVRQPDSVAGLVLYGVAVNNLKEILTYIFSDGDFLRARPVDKNKDGVVTREEWDAVVKNQDFAKSDLNGDGKFTVEDIKVATKKYLDAIASDDYEVLQTWAEGGGAAVSLPKDWFKDHFAHADNWTFLSRLKIPVGFLHGDADRNAPISAVKELEAKAKKANLTKMEFHYFEGLDHSLNIVPYFINGKLPKGHQAIFAFIDRIAPAKR
jgi:pimeloyl-ACP methyl ester carboxylesterase